MNKHLRTLITLPLLFFPVWVMAQQNQTDPKNTMLAPDKHSLMFDVGTQHLSDGYSDWYNATLWGVYETGKHVLQGELSEKREFDENGAFAGLSDTYIFNPDWFSMVSIGAGDGAFYLPTFRADASLNRKFLANRNLVGSVGTGYYNAPDEHQDTYLSMGAAYYFESAWILEGGIRENNSDPGSVKTHQQYVAATYGYGNKNMFIGRYDWGEEGYLAITENTNLVNFDSHETSLTWRHAVTEQAGFNVKINRYDNPSYSREGVNVGVFYQF